MSSTIYLGDSAPNIKIVRDLCVFREKDDFEEGATVCFNFEDFWDTLCPAVKDKKEIAVNGYEIDSDKVFYVTYQGTTFSIVRVGTGEPVITNIPWQGFVVRCC